MNKNPPLALLVQLPIPPPGPQPIQGNVPLAAAYLKLYAQRRGLEGWQIDILPARLCNKLGDRAIVAVILDRRPQLVGFTCYLWNIQRTVWIAQQLKAAQPELRILLGGPEITNDNRWVLEHPAIDLVTIGEGEQTFVDLLSALHAGRSTEGVPGLWHRGGSPPPPRTALADLDLISSPYIEGLLDAGDEHTMLMETSRGCRYRCKFCYYPKSYESIYRMSVGQIEANLRHACQRGVKEIYLLDPTLNQRPDFAGFLRLLAQGNPDHQFTYSAELRAEGIRAETARLLREANFQEVEIGLQSVDPEAQKLMGRHVSLEAFERGARTMLDEGIRVRVDLILGLPGDTVDSVRRGLEYLDRVRPFTELQVFNLSILPGTAFRQTAGDLGLEYQPHPPYYVLKTPTLDLEDLYGLMEEAQDVFGIVFDALPPPEVEEGIEGCFDRNMLTEKWM
ncbi:MAG: B12-binding domain-containing radical SAM protein, partial [Thermoguttaceae bacterium]